MTRPDATMAILEFRRRLRAARLHVRGLSKHPPVLGKTLAFSEEEVQRLDEAVTFIFGVDRPEDAR